MDTASISRYLTLSDHDRIEVLIQFAHELTILARDTYDEGSPQVLHAQRFRAINEIQHRILSHTRALWHRDSARYPEEVLTQMILEQDDPILKHQIQHLFSRIITHETAA